MSPKAFQFIFIVVVLCMSACAVRLVKRGCYDDCKAIQHRCFNWCAVPDQCNGCLTVSKGCFANCRTERNNIGLEDDSFDLKKDRITY